MSVKKRANPEAGTDSTFKLHTSEMQCCGADGLTTAKYVVPYDTGEEIANIVIVVDGVNKTVPLSLIAGTTPKEIRIAIAKALKDNGFDPYYTSDNLIGISVVDGEICVIGEAVLVSIDNDGDVPFVVRATQARIVVSRLVFETDNEDSDLGYDGVTSALPDVGTVKAEVETALTALGVTYTKVVVDTTGTTNTVDIHSTAECEDLSYDAVEATCVKIYPDFIA